MSSGKTGGVVWHLRILLGKTGRFYIVFLDSIERLIRGITEKACALRLHKDNNRSKQTKHDRSNVDIRCREYYFFQHSP